MITNVSVSENDVSLIIKNFPQMIKTFVPFILSHSNSLKFFMSNNNFVDYIEENRSDVMRTIAESQNIFLDYCAEEYRKKHPTNPVLHGSEFFFYHDLDEEKFEIFSRALGLSNINHRSELITYLLKARKTMCGVILINRLIQMGVDADFVDHSIDLDIDHTPIKIKGVLNIMICSSANYYFIQELLDRNPDAINSTVDGITALHVLLKFDPDCFGYYEKYFDNMKVIYENNETSILRLASKNVSTFNYILQMKQFRVSAKYDKFASFKKIFLHNNNELGVPSFKAFVEGIQFNPRSVGIEFILTLLDYLNEDPTNVLIKNILMHVVKTYEFNYEDSHNGREVFGVLAKLPLALTQTCHDFVDCIIIDKGYFPLYDQLMKIVEIELKSRPYMRSLSFLSKK